MTRWELFVDSLESSQSYLKQMVETILVLSWFEGWQNDMQPEQTGAFQ